jgi:hypothetical protein
VVIINDAEHQYSEKYARNTLYSDHQIQKLIENKKLVPVTRDNLNSAMSLETFDKYQALAKKMLPEGSKIPDLYLDYTQYADDYAQAATVLSKEGIEAAIYKFNEQGKRINLADFEHKTTGPEVLHQNAIDNVNGAMINGKPESFYTLQGAMHSENPAGNLAVFTQNGFHTIDIAIAPAEVSHLGLTQQKDIVTPSYLYSLNADKGFSGQTAQDNYIDIRQTPQWPKTRSQCIAELPIEFQKAMPPEVDIFKLVPSSTPSLDLDTIDTTPKKTR